jgi:hypothetical protein
MRGSRTRPGRRFGARPVSRSATALLVCCSMLVATLATAGPAAAEKTVSLSTGIIELSLPPGGSGVGSLKVANTGTQILKALVYVADAQIDPKGMPVYARPAPAQAPDPKSPATWVQLKMPESTRIIANTPYVELKAGEELPVAFAESVPTGASPGDFNAVIFFEMFETDPASPNVSVSKVTGRIGCRVVTHVQGEVRDSIKVKPFVVRDFVLGDQMPFAFTIINDGNVDKRYSASLILRDAAGNDVWTSQVASQAMVYAGDHTNYSGVSILKGVGLGRYEAVVKVDHALVSRDASAPPQVHAYELSRDIWVVPFWIAVVIVALLALLVLWLVWFFTMRRRRAKSATRAAGTPATDSAPQPERSSLGDLPLAAPPAPRTPDDRHTPPPPTARG